MPECALANVQIRSCASRTPVHDCQIDALPVTHRANLEAAEGVGIGVGGGGRGVEDDMGDGDDVVGGGGAYATGAKPSAVLILARQRRMKLHLGLV